MHRALWISLIGLGCSSAQVPPVVVIEPEPEPESEAAQINAYIASLPYLPLASASITEGGRSPDEREDEYSCSTQSYAETRQFDRVVAYAANSDAMYPGAIIAADSVVTGLFTQLVLPRAPATISVSLENLAGTKSAVVQQPSLSAYRDALSDILDAEITGSTPANLHSEIEQVHSESQLNMALSVQASWSLGIASLKSSFNWGNRDVRSRHIVRYIQTYYTVDLDTPAEPSALFAPSVRLADVQAKMDERRPPVYVSSVTYGRLVLFTFESQYSADEMSAALDFAYSGGIDIRGDVSVTYKDMISQSNITAFILGGDAGTAARTIDSYEALIDFIKTGGNYTRQSPGAPIAYKLSYLKDGSPARMSVTTDYQVKDCVRVAQRIRVTLQSIAVDEAADAGDDLELYGRITAEGANLATLFDKDSDHWVRIHEGTVFGAGGPLAEAVIDVAPRPGEAIRLHTRLTDEDSTSGDDNIGDDVLLNLYETGWRKDVTMTLTGDGARVRVNFSFEPI